MARLKRHFDPPGGLAKGAPGFLFVEQQPASRQAPIALHISESFHHDFGNEKTASRGCAGGLVGEDGNANLETRDRTTLSYILFKLFGKIGQTGGVATKFLAKVDCAPDIKKSYLINLVSRVLVAAGFTGATAPDDRSDPELG